MYCIFCLMRGVCGGGLDVLVKRPRKSEESGTERRQDRFT